MRSIGVKIYNFLIKKFGDCGLEKIYLVRVIYYFLRKRFISDYAIVHGNKMYLDPNDSLDLSINNTYEEQETELIKREVKNGDTVVDIGQNIGYYTLILAGLVGESGKVYAFEPDPDNYEILSKNIEINGYRNVVAVNKAVSNKNDKVSFYVNSRNTGDNRLMDFSGSAKKIDVETVRLDDFFAEANTPLNLIKMDIQGSEGLALSGMKKVILRNDNIKIISEFWPEEMGKYGVKYTEFLSYFEDTGFKVSIIDEDNKKITQSNYSDIGEYFKTNTGKYLNLFFKRH